jgi:hypothetical protein
MAAPRFSLGERLQQDRLGHRLKRSAAPWRIRAIIKMLRLLANPQSIEAKVNTPTHVVRKRFRPK